MSLPKLLQTKKQEWRDKNNVTQLADKARRHLGLFNSDGHLSDLVLAKSYVDELHQIYMRRENGEES